MSKRSRTKHRHRKRNYSRNARKDKSRERKGILILIILLIIFTLIIAQQGWLGSGSSQQDASSQANMEEDTGGSTPPLPPELPPSNTLVVSAHVSKQKPKENPPDKVKIPDFPVIFDKEQFLHLNTELTNQRKELDLPEFDITLKYIGGPEILIKRWVYPDVTTPRPEQASSMNKVANPSGVPSKKDSAGEAEVGAGNTVGNVDLNSNLAPAKEAQPELSKEIIEFNHIFKTGSNVEKNGGVGADEEFFIGLPMDMQHTPLHLQLIISQTGSTNIECPVSMAFMIECKAPPKTGGTRQLKLLGGQDWKYEKMFLSELSLTKLHDTDGDEVFYAKYTPIQTGGRAFYSDKLNLVTRQLYLYPKSSSVSYFYCEFSNMEAPKKVWLPLLSGTGPAEGTRFKEHGEADYFEVIPVQMKKDNIEIWAARIIYDETEQGIDPDLRNRIKNRSVDTLGSYDPIPDFEDRLRYIKRENNRITGIALESKVGQIDYYPLSIDQVKSMHKKGGDIFFQPKSRIFQVEITDEINGTRISGVKFEAAPIPNASGANSNSIEVVNFRKLSKFYEIELGFRKPEGDVKDWGGSIIVSADGYKPTTIHTSDLGEGGAVPATQFALVAEVNNLVILIPFSSQFKKQFETVYGADNYPQKANSKDMRNQKPIYFARADGNRGLGLLPRFISVLKNTILRGKSSLPESANSLEVDIFWVTKEELKEYQEDMRNTGGLSEASVDYPAMLSGEFGEIFNDHRSRFGPHTTVIALVGGIPDPSAVLYNKDVESRIKSQHIVLFSHSNNGAFEVQKAFAQNNSNVSHIVNDPTSLSVLTKEATIIANKILNELRKKSEEEE